MTEIRFFVPGLPAPGGSKSAFVPTNRKTGEPYRGKGGRIIVNVVDSGGERTKNWRSSVVSEALGPFLRRFRRSWTCLYGIPVSFANSGNEEQADLAPLTGPLELELQFKMPRPKSHFRSDGIQLKPGAPSHHIIRPDCGKLARSTTDAMTGIVWRDDAQIVVDHGEKAFSDRPGCWVVVREAEFKPAVPPPTECPPSGSRAI